MRKEEFENPLRVYISSGNIESREKIVNLGLVVISPMIETVISPDVIQDLEFVGLLPSKRWTTNSSPRSTVFFAKDALDYGGDPVKDSSEAAMNLGSILLAKIGRELDVNVLDGPNSIVDVFSAEI